MKPKETESDRIRDPTMALRIAGCVAFGSNQEPGESAVSSVWIQIPMTTLAATRKQIEALLWKNSLEELGRGPLANRLATCCHMFPQDTHTHTHIYIYIHTHKAL